MRRALALAATPGVPLGPNPRVGCVLLSASGTTIGEGFHRGAGTPHAEADALANARGDTSGATAVVTLEPCRHTGRTGPCTQALLDAGVGRVVAAQQDPDPVAAGGAAALRAAGVDVQVGVCEGEARYLNRAWLFGVQHARPLVTWKLATTLDGRAAAPDGTSRWISNAAARADTHRLRASVDTMLVGTGTVGSDDPQLTARGRQGRLLAHQPLRVVVGTRTLDGGLRIFDDAAETVHLQTRDPHAVLTDLFQRGRRHVLLEGGPTLAAGFWRAGLVDEVVAYVAPVLLGSGSPSVADLGITTIDEAARPIVDDVQIIDDPDGREPNIRLTMRPDHA